MALVFNSVCFFLSLFCFTGVVLFPYLLTEETFVGFAGMVCTFLVSFANLLISLLASFIERKNKKSNQKKEK